MEPGSYFYIMAYTFEGVMRGHTEGTLEVKSNTTAYSVYQHVKSSISVPEYVKKEAALSVNYYYIAKNEDESISLIKDIKEKLDMICSWLSMKKKIEKA